MDDIVGTIVGTILAGLLLVLTLVFGLSVGFDQGQISVASGIYSCAIEGEVRDDKTIETEWVCTVKEKD